VTGLGVLLFVAFLLLAIGLHEAGHFATAKVFGIKVDKFFIGFGPKLWSTKRGETEYGVSVLPFGGYVKIAGMNPLEEVAPEDRHRAFKAKPAWQRAIVLAAGSITHFFVAIIIIASILAIVGQPDPNRPTLSVGGVGANDPGVVAPAEKAGLKPGDRIVAIDGIEVKSWDELVALVRERPNTTVTIVLERDGRRMERPVTLGERVLEGRTVGFLGVSSDFEKIEYSFPSAIGQAAEEVGRGMKDSLLAFKRIFSPATLGRLFKVAAGEEERKIDDPTSVVGIGKISGDAAKRGDFVSLFLIVAGFNVFIGVANLLPLPPLDGGHLAVLAAEKITRREIDMRRLLPITAMVLTIFGTLFLLLLYLDIAKPLPSLPG
jgi:membrane-associated protease RseP (regulator of RpoE activity)